MEEQFASTELDLSGNVAAVELPQKKPPAKLVSLDTFESVVLAAAPSAVPETKRKQAENERKHALRQAKFRYFCNKIH